MAIRSSAFRPDGLLKRERAPDALARMAALETANEELREANRRLRLDNEALSRLAFIDPLTGLGNRRYFDRYLESELRRAARSSSPLGLILFDIDDFKACNDRYGHSAGDLVLISIGDILKIFCRRAGDAATRHGGDEFAIILPDLRPQALHAMCEVLRQAVKATRLARDWIRDPVTASIGAACLQGGISCSAATLIETADKALYRAKRTAGKDSVRIDVIGDNRRDQSVRAADQNQSSTE